MATVTSHSTTRLTFVTPQAYHSGAVDVQVLTLDQDGTEVRDTLTGAFTYYSAFTGRPSTSASGTRTTASATASGSASGTGGSTGSASPTASASSSGGGAPEVPGVTFEAVGDVLGERYRDLFAMLPQTCYLRCDPVRL